MKTHLIIPLFGLFALAAFAFADENPHMGGETRDHEGRDRYLSHGHGGFGLGVCVGQTLASQGVTIPAPTPGQSYLQTQDPTVQDAIDSAVQTCRAEFSGSTPSGTPSQAPSGAPSVAPTVAPSQAPSAVAPSGTSANSSKPLGMGTGELDRTG